MLTTQTAALKICMANAGVDCEASELTINIARMIPIDQAIKIIAAAALYNACNPSAGGAPHALGGAQHTADTLVNLSALVSDATILGIKATPAASGDPGALGDIAQDANYFYFHNGTQWLRTAGAIF